MEGNRAIITVRPVTYCIPAGTSLDQGPVNEWVMIADDDVVAGTATYGWAQAGYYHTPDGQVRHWAQSVGPNLSQLRESFAGAATVHQNFLYTVRYNVIAGEFQMLVGATLIMGSGFDPFCGATCSSPGFDVDPNFSWVPETMAEVDNIGSDIPGVTLNPVNVSAMQLQTCCADNFDGDWDSTRNLHIDYQPGRWTATVPIANSFQSWTNHP
jgi:hypothetical protein